MQRLRDRGDDRIQSGQLLTRHKVIHRQWCCHQAATAVPCERLERRFGRAGSGTALILILRPWEWRLDSQSEIRGRAINGLNYLSESPWDALPARCDSRLLGHTSFCSGLTADATEPPRVLRQVESAGRCVAAKSAVDQPMTWGASAGKRTSQQGPGCVATLRACPVCSGAPGHGRKNAQGQHGTHHQGTSWFEAIEEVSFVHCRQAQVGARRAKESIGVAQAPDHEPSRNSGEMAGRAALDWKGRKENLAGSGLGRLFCAMY
jgi:hypothetical protein